MQNDAAKTAWVARFLDIEIPDDDGETVGDSGEQGGVGNAMAAWKAARGTALASLKALENEFRAMDEPETDEAIILLRAIQANLTETPDTSAQVYELENYIMTDDIILEAEEPNGFGFKVELRGPLLMALTDLRAELDLVGGLAP